MTDNPTMAPDEHYCSACGKVIKKAAEMCPHCGVRHLPPPTSVQQGRDWLVALLLCIFLGNMGVHRFYTGHILIGFLQLLTCGLCGIWQLVDLILIATGSLTDADGRPLTR